MKLHTVVLSTFVCLLHINTGYGDVIQLGHDPVPHNPRGVNIIPGKFIPWIMTNPALITQMKTVAPGVLQYFQFCSISTNPVFLQIWRDMGQNMYELKYQKRFVPTGINVTYTVCPDQKYQMDSKDAIGFTTDKSGNVATIAYKFISDKGAKPDEHITRLDTFTAQPVVGATLEFGTQLQVYKYSYRIGINKDLNSEEYKKCQDYLKTTPSPATTTTLKSTTPIPDPNRIGNPIVSGSLSSSGQNMVFILSNYDLPHGKVNKFIFQSGDTNGYLRLQVWRPQGSQYKLVGEERVLVDSEKIYEVSTGISVVKGDRIGFITEGARIPIVYTTDPGSTGSVCVNIAKVGSSYPEVGKSYQPESGTIDAFKWSIAAQVERGPAPTTAETTPASTTKKPGKKEQVFKEESVESIIQNYLGWIIAGVVAFIIIIAGSVILCFYRKEIKHGPKSTHGYDNASLPSRISNGRQHNGDLESNLTNDQSHYTEPNGGQDNTGANFRDQDFAGY